MFMSIKQATGQLLKSRAKLIKLLESLKDEEQAAQADLVKKFLDRHQGASAELASVEQALKNLGHAEPPPIGNPPPRPEPVATKAEPLAVEKRDLPSGKVAKA